MVAALALLLLAGETALYSLVLSRVFFAAWPGAPMALSFAVALWLLVRLALVLASFALSRWFRRTAWEPLGVGGWIRMVAGEWAAVVVHQVLLLPFHRLLPWPSAGNGGGPAVVLVHGLWNNRGVWWLLARVLARSGAGAVDAVSYGPPWASIERFAEELAVRIEGVRRAHPGREVVLVGHSMGGLVARACLARRGAAAVARLVTVGTPHHGSELARLAAGKCGRELRPGSRLLAVLNADERPPVAAVSIRSDHDNLVSPQSSAELAGARTVRIDGIGHNAMHLSRTVHAAIVAAVRDPLPDR